MQANNMERFGPPPPSSIDEESGVVHVPAASPSTRTSLPEIISAPELSQYMDYRKFLLHYYEYRRALSKKDLRPYNYSVFSAAADIKSPNYMKMIIDGKRNLSKDMILKFARALALNKDQTEEFEILVRFNQDTDPAERNFHLRELTKVRVENQLKSGAIDKKAWEKIPNWVAWIIYAMIDQRNVRYKADELKSLLRGKASVNEINEAMNMLERAGEINRDPQTGIISKSRTLIDSPDDIPVSLVRKLQAQLMYLGLESLYQDQATEREFGSLTLALTKEEFEQIKFQLRKMRKEIHKDNSIKRMTTKGERVYQLNLQLFPVTDKA